MKINLSNVRNTVLFMVSLSFCVFPRNPLQLSNVAKLSVDSSPLERNHMLGLVFARI